MSFQGFCCAPPPAHFCRPSGPYHFSTAHAWADEVVFGWRRFGFGNAGHLEEFFRGEWLKGKGLGLGGFRREGEGVLDVENGAARFGMRIQAEGEDISHGGKGIPL